MGGENKPRRKPMKKKEIINAAQLSLILDISEKTVKKLAKDRELPCEYRNRQPRFNMPAIIRHFERLEGGAA